MYFNMKYGHLLLAVLYISLQQSAIDALLRESKPKLTISSAGDLDTDVIVKRVNDTLNLTCEYHNADNSTEKYVVWNFASGTNTSLSRPYNWASTTLPGRGSRLVVLRLQLNNTGHFICTAPKLSQTKYVIVQPKGIKPCVKGGFSCAHMCVMPLYVCDGYKDCEGGEDEAPATCGTADPCDGKLNCSDSRCLSPSLCCDRTLKSDCIRPKCCEEHMSDTEMYFNELREQLTVCPLPGEERHYGEDYGFIQTTIYTVTACALIFMIAVVLLVSAICKMHMKRAALRTQYRYPYHYLHALHTHAHQNRYPPCYEASRLMEPEARVASVVSSQNNSPQSSPRHQGAPSESRADGAGAECPGDEAAGGAAAAARPGGFGRGLADVIFNGRYRPQPDVEMSTVRPDQLGERYLAYRSPTSCEDFSTADRHGRDLNVELLVGAGAGAAARRANAVERILDRLAFPSCRLDDEPNLTLQLGRFSLNIPRLVRTRSSDERRPDTPNVTEVNINDLDFVRLNSNETYTLNGRTIRLLGGSFENYPTVIAHGNTDSFVGRVVRPPPYSECVSVAPAKNVGPPPLYLSTECLGDRTGVEDANGNVASAVTETARNNNADNDNGNVASIEPPPQYDDVNAHTGSTDANANNEMDNEI